MQVKMESASLPRPAERTAILSLVLVFLCGGLLGAVVMSYAHPGIHKYKQTAPVGLTISVSELKHQLGLNEEQVRQLSSILDDFGHYYDNLLADGNTRVLQVLTPEQRIRYEKLKLDHRDK